MASAPWLGLGLGLGLLACGDDGAAGGGSSPGGGGSSGDGGAGAAGAAAPVGAGGEGAAGGEAGMGGQTADLFLPIECVGPTGDCTSSGALHRVDLSGPNSFVALGRVEGDVSIGELLVESPSGQGNYVVFELDGELTSGWQTLIEHEGNAALPTDLAVPESGGVALVLSPSADVTIEGQTFPMQGPQDGLLVRLAENGSVQWARRVGGTGETVLSEIVEWYGLLVVAGTFTGTADFGMGEMTAPVGHEGVLAAYDATSGEPLWVMTFGGVDLSPRVFAAITGQNELTIVGATTATEMNLWFGGSPVLGPSDGAAAFAVRLVPGMGPVVGATYLAPGLAPTSAVSHTDSMVVIGNFLMAQRLNSDLTPDWLLDTPAMGFGGGYQGCVRGSDGLLAMGTLLTGSVTIGSKTIEHEPTAGSLVVFADAEGEAVDVIDLADHWTHQDCAFLSDERLVLVGSGGLSLVTPPL